jgi:hypothetical protein
MTQLLAIPAYNVAVTTVVNTTTTTSFKTKHFTFMAAFERREVLKNQTYQHIS